MRPCFALSCALAGLLTLTSAILPASAQWKPLEIPFVDEWASSPHARAGDEPFTHWDEEGVIPPACARCHSSAGFRDHIGADGSPAGVDRPALAGSGGITCIACHNDAARRMESVTFPSGVIVTGVGKDGVCMTCHQGRESTGSVDAALAGRDDDTPDDTLGFINVHYRPAAAMLFGSEAKVGYEFAGRDYAGRYAHAKGNSGCVECHDSHTLRVTTAQCSACHSETEIGSVADLRRLRKSPVDFDGDGDTAEGIEGEIATLSEALMAAIQGYASEVAGQPVAYDPHAYPYFFNDRDGDGKAGKGEAIFPNQYRLWTPRLLRSAYNYQFLAKEPGAYAHNPVYALQLLYDSLENLSAKTPVAIETLQRPAR